MYNLKQHELRQYATNPNIRARWDSLQREYSCCGGRNQGTGYTDWEGLDVDPLPYQALEFRVSKNVTALNCIKTSYFRLSYLILQ